MQEKKMKRAEERRGKYIRKRRKERRRGEWKATGLYDEMIRRMGRMYLLVVEHSLPVHEVT